MAAFGGAQAAFAAQVPGAVSPGQAPGAVQPARQVIPATVGAIEENPALYLGQVVTVNGEVDNCGELGPGAFEIEGDEFLFTDEDVPVVMPSRTGLQPLLSPFGGLSAFSFAEPFQPLALCGGFFGGAGDIDGFDFGLRDDEFVQVTGVVRLFNIGEFESALGFDLDDQLFTEFEGDPVIVAFRVFDPGLTPLRR